MKKLIIMGTLLAVLILSLLPTAVGAWDFSQGCCQYTDCCRELCCANITYWYKVSYFERIWNTDINMWSHKWVFQYIKAHNSKAAAKLLGLEAGYNCFVVRAIGYHG